MSKETTIDNITVNQLLQLEDSSEYHVLQMLEPKAQIGNEAAKTFEEILFGDVIEIRRILSETNPDELIKTFRWVFGMEEGQVLNLDVVSFYQAVNHIVSETERLIRLEESLHSKNEKWEQAGGEKMNKYGAFGILMSLAEQFGTTPMEVEKIPYGVVFMVLSYNKDLGEVREAFSKLK